MPRPTVSKARRFWRAVGKITLWGLIGLAAFVLYSNVAKETAYLLSVIVIAFAFNYEIQAIKEKLDTIQWNLDDLRCGEDDRYDLP